GPASSSTTSSESSRHWRLARSRISVRHCRISRSRIPHSREIANQLEEVLPFLPLGRQHLTAFSRDPVVAAPALSRFFNPPALDPLALFELVEGGVQRGEVERERPAGSLNDELRQLVAVPRLVVEERKHDQFGGALLGFADRAGELHAANIFRTPEYSQHRGVRGACHATYSCSRY